MTPSSSATIEIVEPRLFAGAVADEIVASMADVLAEKASCSIVLAGGNTPAAIYRLMARPPRVSDVDWSAVSVFWGDERWVPHTNDLSNFKMASETLLSLMPKPGPKVFPVDTAKPTPEQSAADYNETIKRELQLTGADRPVFDLVLLGVGTDGHTASIFPNSEVLGDLGGKKPLAQAVKHPEDGSQRITLSPEALFSAAKIIFIVNGESKSDIVREIHEGTLEVSRVPAKLAHQAAGRVTWFLDTGAAAKLRQRSA